MTGLGIQGILCLVSEIGVKGGTGSCAICNTDLLLSVEMHILHQIVREKL